jgi:hypothetical protein
LDALLPAILPPWPGFGGTSDRAFIRLHPISGAWRARVPIRRVDGEPRSERKAVERAKAKKLARPAGGYPQRGR